MALFNLQQYLKGSFTKRHGEGMGKMTLKELADRLDVSVSAISLAINGKPGLSDETRSRILAEVESVGYPLKERAEQFTKILLLFCKDSGSSRPGSTHGTDYIFMDLQQGVLDLASSENCVAAIQYWDVEKPLNLDSFRVMSGFCYSIRLCFLWKSSTNCFPAAFPWSW